MMPATVPAWLRRATADPQHLAKQGIEDVGIAAGAAIGVLDAFIRRQDASAGVWRQRLALKAAAQFARRSGRTEDEGGLRDAVLLTRPGDNVGPAGQMLLGWRNLATWQADESLQARNLAVTLEAFGHGSGSETAGDLAQMVSQLRSGTGMAEMLTGAFMATERCRVARAFGAWLADALLAQRFGWINAVPLLGTERSAGTGPEESKRLLATLACTALRAMDLSADLERRAERLLAVAPKLRARAADSVVHRLLSEDAIVASEKVAGMSDRGLRRLFDRLLELGVVRELSGRATFRVYGL